MIITEIRVLIWKLLTKSLYPAYLRIIYKMDIGKDVMISHKAILDKSVNPKGLHVGEIVLILLQVLRFCVTMHGEA